VLLFEKARGNKADFEARISPLGVGLRANSLQFCVACAVRLDDLIRFVKIPELVHRILYFCKEIAAVWGSMLH